MLTSFGKNSADRNRNSNGRTKKASSKQTPTVIATKGNAKKPETTTAALLTEISNENITPNMKCFSMDVKSTNGGSPSIVEGVLVEESSELLAKLLEEINSMKNDIDGLKKDSVGLKKDVAVLKKDNRVLMTIIRKKLKYSATEKAEFFGKDGLSA